MGGDKHAPQAECGSGSPGTGQGECALTTELSSVGSRPQGASAGDTGCNSYPGGQVGSPTLPPGACFPIQSRKPTGHWGRVRWRLLPELKHNPQVSGDEAEHLPASGRRGRRGSPPDTGHFSGKVQTKPLQPQGRAGSPPERKGPHEHRLDQVSCWGGKGSDTEKRPQPWAWSSGCTRTASPPHICHQQHVTAPSLGVESLGQTGPLRPTGEARPRHTPLKAPGTSRSR